MAGPVLRIVGALGLVVLCSTASGCPAGDAPEEGERSHDSDPTEWTGELALAQAESDLSRGDTDGATAALARVPRHGAFAKRREALKARLVEALLGRFRQALVDVDPDVMAGADKASARGGDDGPSSAKARLEALQSIRFDAAEDLLTKLRALAPDAPDVVQAGVLLAERKKKLEEAIARGGEAVQGQRDGGYVVLIRTEDIYLQAAMAPIVDRLAEGAYAEARRLLKAGPKPEQDLPNVRRAMRRALVALNRYEREMQAANEAEAAGRRARAARHYARAYEAAEDLPGEAPRERAADAAIRDYDTLARSAVERKQWAEAAADWSAAWRIGQDDERVEKGLEILDERARPIFEQAEQDSVIAPRRARRTLRRILKETATMCEYHIKAKRKLEEMASGAR